jgi:hypothetical protein
MRQANDVGGSKMTSICNLSRVEEKFRPGLGIPVSPKEGVRMPKVDVASWTGTSARHLEVQGQASQRLQLDRSTALYTYKAKNCKLLVLFTHTQKTKFIFK